MNLNNDIVFQKLQNICNEFINFHFYEFIFNELAVIAPVYKKYRPKKETCATVITLSVISKMFERCFYDQICKNVDNILLRLRVGNRKVFSSQYSLISMFKKI